MLNADQTFLKLIKLILTNHPHLAHHVMMMARTASRSGEHDLKETFTDIFLKNRWGSDESVSGAGSTLKYTENLRIKLPLMFKDFGIRRVLDAPCGDFNWMAEVMKDTNLEYVGADIVESIIFKNKSTHSAINIDFCQLDITKDQLPTADLMICRDCLFHLSYEKIKLFIENFKKSNIRYLLTTSHRNNNVFTNRDIPNGAFRLLDLFSTPFNFPQSPLVIIEDWVPPFPERDMILWNKEQLSSVDIMF
jgi:hypothetical protein